MTHGGNTNVAVPDAIFPDGGWGWVIVFSSFMIHFIMDGITYAMAEIFLEPMKTALHLERSYVSAIFSILPAVTLGTGPIATVFTNMYGCRAVTIVGACVAAIGFFLSRWWVNIVYYYVTIGIIGGIGFGLIYVPAIVSVGNYFERKRSFALGIAVSASGFGTVVFPLTMHWVINSLFGKDYKPALLVESAVISICVIFGFLIIPLPHEHSEKRRAQIRLQKEVKRQAVREVQNVGNTDEQQTQLLAERESVPREEVNVALPASDNTDRHEQPGVSDTNSRKSLSLQDVPSALCDDSDTKSKSSLSPTAVVTIRKDAMYQGSLDHIPLYNENIDEYHRQIITTFDTTNEPVQTTGDINSTTVPNIENEKVKSFAGQLRDQVSLKFLTDAAFLLFTISNFLTSLGFNVPYNFARDLAKDADVEESHREFVIMSIGLSNAVGRIIIGFLGDRTWINRLALYNSILIIAGLATIMAPYCNSNVVTHIIYASIFGFFSGGYVGLTSIIITDLVGINNLPSALGIVLLFQGVAVAIGTPIAGGMRDAFEKHSRPFLWPYFTFGSFIVFSGIILFAIPFLKRRQEHRKSLTKNELDMGVVSYSDRNPTSQEQQQQL